MSMNRREFVTRSVLSLGAIGLARTFGRRTGWRASAGSGGTNAARYQVRRDPPRCRLLHRHWRNHRIPRERRRRGRHRQPVHADRRALRRRAQTAGTQGHRNTDQHPPPRRPHQRQWRLPPRGEAHPGPRELRDLAAQGRRGGRREAARTGRRGARAARRRGFDVQGHLELRVRQRESARAVLRAWTHERRRRDLLRAGERHPRRRSALPPRAPAGGRAGRCVGRQLARHSPED